MTGKRRDGSRAYAGGRYTVAVRAVLSPSRLPRSAGLSNWSSASRPCSGGSLELEASLSVAAGTGRVAACGVAVVRVHAAVATSAHETTIEQPAVPMRATYQLERRHGTAPELRHARRLQSRPHTSLLLER